MAATAEIQLMKITAFTVGSTTYTGIRTLKSTETPLNTYGVMEEGQVRPTRLEQIETDGARYKFSIQLSSIAAEALGGTSAATMTVTGRNVMLSTGTMTVTHTGVTFDGVDLGAQNKSVDGVTITGSATGRSVA